MTRRALFRVMVLGVAAWSSAGWAQSRYASIKNGVGNIILGEDLPYNKEGEFRNPIIDRVRESQLSQFKQICVRAYLAKRLADIKHDVRVFVWRFTGVGGKKDLNEVYVVVRKPADTPPQFQDRDQWAICWPNFDKDGWDMQGYIDLPWIDPATHVEDRSKGFQYTLGHLRDLENFGPAKFRAWREQYGMKEIRLTVTAYAFSRLYDEAYGKNVTRLVPQKDGSVVARSDFVEEGSAPVYGEGTVLARGEFTIQMDGR